jgi:hypothetical protein
MLHPIIKKAVKPLVLLLIINSLNSFSQKSYSQVKKNFTDSTLLKKEIDNLLAKHGLKSTGFSINVISVNQKGGQTAYSITNNYYGLKPREVTNDIMSEVEKQVLNKETPVTVYRRSQDAESFEYATKIILALRKAGYLNSFVNGITNDQMIGGDPVEAAKQQATIAYKWDGSQFAIVIPSNK